jgi:hypothetical protein
VHAHLKSIAALLVVDVPYDVPPQKNQMPRRPFDGAAMIKNNHS